LHALTQDKLLQVAQQYLKPSEFTVFVEAEAIRVTDQIKALGLGSWLIRPSPRVKARAFSIQGCPSRLSDCFVLFPSRAGFMPCRL
jgi:hypothetical protein